MIHNVVTSFHEEGYERYGKACVESFIKHWPKNVRLTCFYEGDKFNFTEGVSWRPYEEIKPLQHYLDCLKFPMQHGLVNGSYNIQFDATQARKVFIEAHAAQLYGGKVFWMDADTVTHSDVPEGFLDELLPDDKFNVFCGRETEKGRWMYSETGFIGYNTNHPISEKFFRNYVNLYLQGINFTFPGWHDCYGFDALRDMIGPEPFINLAKGQPQGTMHPLINTVLGKYIDHRKGPRKDSRSTEKDLVAPREEAYWNAN